MNVLSKAKGAHLGLLGLLLFVLTADRTALRPRPPVTSDDPGDGLDGRTLFDAEDELDAAGRRVVRVRVGVGVGLEDAQETSEGDVRVVVGRGLAKLDGPVVPASQLGARIVPGEPASFAVDDRDLQVVCHKRSHSPQVRVDHNTAGRRHEAKAFTLVGSRTDLVRGVREPLQHELGVVAELVHACADGTSDGQSAAVRVGGVGTQSRAGGEGDLAHLSNVGAQSREVAREGRVVLVERAVLTLVYKFSESSCW